MTVNGQSTATLTTQQTQRLLDHSADHIVQVVIARKVNYW